MKHSNIMIVNEKTLLNKRLYHTIRDPKKNMSNNEQQSQPPENAQQEPVSTTNAILTEKEALEMQSQQHAQNPNMPQPPNQNQNQSLSAQETQPSAAETVSQPDSNRSNTQENIQQQSSNVVPFPQPEPPIVNNNNQQAQQPIQATTSAGVTAPPPKPDFTDTDASIQGLLLQVVALQHNKIQQLKQQ